MLALQVGNATHDSVVQVAHSTRQVALAAATTQKAATTADIAFYRTCLTSALSLGLTNVISDCQMALLALGTGGR